MLKKLGRLSGKNRDSVKKASGGKRVVQTPAGAKRYGVPIGTAIGAAKAAAVKAKPNKRHEGIVERDDAGTKMIFVRRTRDGKVLHAENVSGLSMSDARRLADIQAKNPRAAARRQKKAKPTPGFTPKSSQRVPGQPADSKLSPQQAALAARIKKLEDKIEGKKFGEDRATEALLDKLYFQAEELNIDPADLW